MNLRQSKEFAQYLKLSGWIVKKVGNHYIYLRKLPFLPPLIMKIQYPTPPIPFVQIEKIAKKYKPLQIQIQPLKIESRFKKYRYKLSKSAGHVTKTIHLDLTQSEGKILAGMAKDARYGVRKAEGIEIEKLRNGDIKGFHQAWKRAVGWRQYVPSLKTLTRLKRAFGKKAIFLTGNWKLEISGACCFAIGNCLAGTVILIAGKTAYYYQAFTSKEGRKKFAQYLLVWEAIKKAKKMGCQIFDFEGVYDERFPQKSWRGFSHFKKSFGGEEIEFPGCFLKYCFPF